MGKQRNTHMTHTHRCSNGQIKKIHWAWDAKVGDIWTCRSCAGNHKLVESGSGGESPIMRQSRKMPISQKQKSLNLPEKSKSGCLFLLAAISLTTLFTFLVLIFFIFTD